MPLISKNGTYQGTYFSWKVGYKNGLIRNLFYSKMIKTHAYHRFNKELRYTMEIYGRYGFIHAPHGVRRTVNEEVRLNVGQISTTGSDCRMAALPYPAYSYNCYSAISCLRLRTLKPIQNTRITDRTAGKKFEPISGYSARTTVLYNKTPRIKQAAARPGSPTGIVRFW